MAKILEATKEKIAELEAKKARRREEILNAPSMEIPKGVVTYYISSINGDDNNDGKTPKTAWATLDKFNNCGAPEGAYVCLERGSSWRGQIQLWKPATVTAYGEGPKPEIIGSPFDGTKHGRWTEVAKNIWRYSETFREDVGMLFFNSGEMFARKVTLSYKDGIVRDFKTGRLWEGYESLSENYEYILDFGGPKYKSEEGVYLYLYCDKGNPAEVFDRIEFAGAGYLVWVLTNHDVTVDNLCLRYGGAHGIASGTIKNLIVTNCEIGYMGGCQHMYTSEGNPTRYGNGVEIYGGCDNYIIDNCWIYECYDAGVTHQYIDFKSNRSVTMKEVHYTNNIIERCVYNIEYFLTSTLAENTDRYMENYYIKGNILTHAGYGFGAQRPDTTVDSHLKSWDFTNWQNGEFVIEDNLFMYSNYMMFHTVCDDEKDMPKVRNNVLVQNKGGQFGRFGMKPSTVLMYTDETTEMEELKDNEFYVVKG